MFERSDDQIRDQLSNYNARLFNLESRSAKQDRNVANLFKNDSLMVVRQPEYQAAENKHGFLSFLYKLL